MLFPCSLPEMCLVSYLLLAGWWQVSCEGRHCNRCIVDVGQGCVPSRSPGVVTVLPGDTPRRAGQASPGNPPAHGEGGSRAVQGHQGDAVSGCVHSLSVPVISDGVAPPLGTCAVTFAKFRMRCSVCLPSPPMQLGSVMRRW